MSLYIFRMFGVQTGYRYLVLIIFLVISILIYLSDVIEFNKNYSRISEFKAPDQTINITKHRKQLEHCKIPTLNPYDNSILKFIFKVDKYNCSKVDPLITSDLNNLYINDELLTSYNVTDTRGFYCCYQSFHRRDPIGQNSDNTIDFEECIPFYSKVEIKDEFVEVICKQNNTILHRDIHSFVPIKQTKHIIAKNKRKLNVLIFGIDSLSRMNFQRQMPKTKKYIDENFNPILMSSYNKVADNTLPNLIPILTGQTLQEISTTCWKNKTFHFDNCHFVWKNFSNAGYLTAFAEDSSWMGLFNYQKNGFKSQPTDYYWRTFNYYAEQKLGHNYLQNSYLCIGARHTHQVLIDYVKKFTLSLKDELYFGLFWSTCLSHDFLNLPALGDDDYVQFFDYLKKSNVLNDTVLIFLSDHGIRWGGIRETHQGHLEERLPFLYLMFPPWFHKLYPTAIENMKENSNRLTSNFDLHETLLDLLDVEKLTTENLNERSLVTSKQRGISLFVPIPENRTCEMAGISDHWCTCKNTVEIDKNDAIVLKVANFIVSYINKLLKIHKKCASLILDLISDARLMISSDYLKNNITLNDYILILSTKPGGAVFESTVRCVNCDLEESFEITGTISRINMYGKQSECIADSFLKLYCYCK